MVAPDQLRAGDVPGWLQIVFYVGATVVSWSVAIATTRRRLIDHIEECDKRYEALSESHKRIEAKLESALSRRRWFWG